ncbi:MAG TPA: hypothetical protein VMK12_07120 [Anaeromyxobacteraceae bacterium]|nr:hypothetical protein [Anaeromyxobacteraceae bacterium]
MKRWLPWALVALLLYAGRGAVLIGLGLTLGVGAFLVGLLKPRHGGIRKWIEAGSVAVIAYRMPPKAKRENISFTPTPVYAMDKREPQTIVDYPESWDDPIWPFAPRRENP